MVGCADIDKSLYQMSNSVSSIDRVTGQRTFNITRRPAQIAQSNAEIEKFIQQAKNENMPLNEEVDAEGYARLLEVFERVHSVSHLKDEDWNLLLIPDDTFNAFVNGGTYVVVHKGMLDGIESDDEIAAILGHELAHVAANHRYEMQSHFVAAYLKGSKSVSRNTFQAAFTHENEEEADEVGILYATLAGYDPNAASHLWKRMYENEGDFSVVVVNHPINSERYNRSAELAQLYMPYYIEGKTNPDAELALENNPVFGRAQNNVSNLEVGAGGGLVSLIEVVGKGLEQHYQARAEEIRQETRIIKIKRINRSLVYLDKEINDPHTVTARVQYNGYETLNNLTFYALLGDEEVINRIEDPVVPRSTLELHFEFKTDLSAALERNEEPQIGINHVD
jgi:hypothetical protein